MLDEADRAKGEETGRLDETGILDPKKWKEFLEE